MMIDFIVYFLDKFVGVTVWSMKNMFGNWEVED